MEKAKEINPNVVVTAYMSYDDWVWMMAKAKKQGLNRSQFLRKVIAQVRAQEAKEA